MNRSSILKRKDCDLKKLPLGAREAFVLSQLDGRLTLEEVGEIAGLELDETLKMAARLVELGAASTPRTSTEHVRVSRPDPRVERESRPPDPRASCRPPASAARSSTQPQTKTRRSRKSLRMPRVTAAAATARTTDGPCELDDATQRTILALDVKLDGLDHYAKLEIERGAEKKAIKRAYFAFASKFHPDRFFGKKLGTLRGPVERIFRSVTEAHDTLVDPARRAKYDATLPPAPPPPRRTSKALPAQPQSPSTPPRKTSKAAMRAASRKMQAVKPPSVKPAARSEKPPAPSLKPPAEASDPPKETVAKPDDRLKRLVANARDIKMLARVDLFVRAAEEALARGDVISAANNYRLALDHREDPFLRCKLDDVEILAKAARFDRSVARARAAERDKRWAEAARHFEEAFEARRDAVVAERAAHAIHACGGDLGRATELAEQAVSMRPKDADFRVTLAEILLAANELERAREEAETALEIAPKDARAKEIARAISRSAKDK
jgi:curved DNA-binding protein CbpA